MNGNMMSSASLLIQDVEMIPLKTTHPSEFQHFPLSFKVCLRVEREERRGKEKRQKIKVPKCLRGNDGRGGVNKCAPDSTNC